MLVARKILTQVASGALVLYSISLFISMAGMEIFSSLIAVCFILLLVLDLKGGQPEKILNILKMPVIIYGLSLFLLGIISALNSPVSKDTFLFMIGRERTTLVAVAFIYLFARKDFKFSPYVLKIILSVIILVCFYAFFQFFTGIDLVRGTNPYIEKIGEYFRAVAFFNLPLTFAYSLGTAFFLILPLGFSSDLFKEDKVFKALFYAAILLMPLALLATSVRGAWLAFILTMIVFLFFLKSRKTWLVALVGLIIGKILLFSIPSFHQRILSIVDLKNSSNSIRMSIWDANIQMFKKYPWLGMGPGQNSHVVMDYYDGIRSKDMIYNFHAHNDILQFLAAYGIFGMTLYILLIGTFLFMSLSLIKRYSGEKHFLYYLSLGTLLAQVFFHIGGMTQCNYIDREVNHMLMCVWVIVFVRYYGERLIPKKDLCV